VLVYEQRKFSLGSVVDPGANYLRGHLAILFGLLMRDDPINQTVLLSAFAGSDNRVILDSLVDQAREFVTFYADLTSRMAVAVAAVEEEENSEPLSDPQHSVERMVRDGKGESVARDIVSFLESLRDSQPELK
jgi:hypothetical protein